MLQYDMKVECWSIKKRLYLHRPKWLACSRKILRPLSAIRLRVKWPRHFIEREDMKFVCKSRLLWLPEILRVLTRSLRTGWQAIEMAYAPRPTAVFPSGSSTGSSLRQPSIGSQNVQQSSALAARIAAKRSELENLKQLKELSGALAAQMGGAGGEVGNTARRDRRFGSPGCNRDGMPIF